MRWGYCLFRHMFDRGIIMSTLRLRGVVKHVVALLLGLATVALCLAAATVASAAPSVAAVSPAQDEVTGTAQPVITALLADAVTPVSASLTVDGVSRPLLADGTGLSFSYTPAATDRLADGPHTAVFSATDGIGDTVTKTWTFDVEVLPAVSSVNPSLSSIVTSRRPGVTVIVYDNSLPATYTLTIDGVRGSYLNTSGYEAALGGYYGVNGYPSVDLADGAHTGYVKVVDPAGHVVEKTWTFYVNGEITITPTGLSDGAELTTATPTWHFRLDSINVQPSFTMSIDGVSGAYTGYGAYSNSNRTYDITTTITNPLTDGAHLVTATGYGGFITKTATYDITVQVPPTVLHLRPSRYAVVSTTTPVLTARATDNSTGAPSFEFTVDGQPVAASPVTSIAPSRWEGTARVTTPLSANATHTAQVTVRDTAGNASTRSWQFFVGTGPQMSHFDAGECATCHGNPYYVHPASSGDSIPFDRKVPCNVCHSYFASHPSWKLATLENPTTYNPATWSTNTCSCHNPGHPNSRYYALNAHYPWNNAQNCRGCHDRLNVFNDVGEPNLDRGESMPLLTEVPRHGVDGDYDRCTQCHQLDLTLEHAQRLDSHGNAVTCQSCHASSDPAVAAAVSSGDSRCDACHVNADHPAKHASATSSGCFGGSGCHPASKQLDAVHDLYVGEGSERPQYKNACALCHKNPTPQDLTSTRCTPACHAGTTHQGMSAGHTVTSASARCTTSACHGTDITGIHGAYSDLERCGWCHTKKDLWSMNGDCANCHTGANLPTSPGHAWDAAAKVDYRTACKKCHWPNFTHYVRKEGDTCGGRRCHRSWPALTDFYMPVTSTAYGLFSNPESVNASSGALHRIHVNGGWIATYLNDSKCESCHGAAACDSCHSAPTHGSHGPAPSQPETYMAAYGAVNNGNLQVNTTNINGDDVRVVSGCSAPKCHVRAKAGTEGFKPACADCH